MHGSVRGAWQEDESPNDRFRLDIKKTTFTLRQAGSRVGCLERHWSLLGLEAIPKAAICTAWVPEEAEASSC